MRYIYLMNRRQVENFLRVVKQYFQVVSVVLVQRPGTKQCRDKLKMDVELYLCDFLEYLKIYENWDALRALDYFPFAMM